MFSRLQMRHLSVKERTYRRLLLDAPDPFETHGDIRGHLLRALLIAVTIAAVPVCSQAQSPRVSKADAQKVVTIISGDKAKTQTYCEIQKLSEQVEEAYEKNDNKMVDELSEKIDKLEETLGPESVALMDGLQDIDPEKDKLAAEIMSIFGALDRLCTR